MLIHERDLQCDVSPCFCLSFMRFTARASADRLERQQIMSHSLVCLFIWSPSVDLDDEIASLQRKAALADRSDLDRAVNVTVETKLSGRRMSKFLQRINENLSTQISYPLVVCRFSDVDLLVVRESSSVQEAAAEYRAYRLDDTTNAAAFDSMASTLVWNVNCKACSIDSFQVLFGQVTSSNNQKLALAEVTTHLVKEDSVAALLESIVSFVQDLLSDDSFSKVKMYSIAGKSERWILARAAIWSNACSTT